MSKSLIVGLIFLLLLAIIFGVFMTNYCSNHPEGCMSHNEKSCRDFCEPNNYLYLYNGGLVGGSMACECEPSRECETEQKVIEK